MASLSRPRNEWDRQRESQSLLVGLDVLSHLSVDVDVGVVDLSETVGISASTTSRYLQTLVGAGLVERHPETRKYRLAALLQPDL